MLHRLGRLLFVGVMLSASGAAATEGAPIRRGTEGLVEVPFAATNGGPGDIACAAALAHWYSLDLGRAAPGERVSATLWYDPKDGTIALLNASRDRMPVQALWCGLAERSWATRAAIGLEHRAASVQAPIRVECRPEAGMLACR